MRNLTRQGMTLAELMVALVLFGIVALAMTRLLIGNERFLGRMTQRAELRQNIRAASALFPSEFRELDAVDGDILAMSDTSITIRGMRQMALLCASPVMTGPNNVVLTVRSPLLSGARPLQVGRDSLLVFYEGDIVDRDDDGWVPARLKTIANGTCPEAGNPAALQLTVDFRPAAGQLMQTGSIVAGAPLRGFEIVTYRLFRDTDNRWYVGLQDFGGTTQPLIGPLRNTNGLMFSFYDANGNVTASRTAVAQIEARLWNTSSARVSGAVGGPVELTDSVVAMMALRNNPVF